VNRRDRGWGTPFRKPIVKLEMANSYFSYFIEYVFVSRVGMRRRLPVTSGTGIKLGRRKR
jgi:hypothetical protein